MRSRTRSTIAPALTRALVAALVAVGLGIASPASARPDVTDDDARAARRAVAATESTVAQIEVLLATRSASLDAAWAGVATAAEDYT
ncbi:MAG: hypothetical protein JWP95_1671, partial [Actinotalea sp.]|nr:hypothetical protein [Actinotalea sp.]